MTQSEWLIAQMLLERERAKLRLPLWWLLQVVPAIP